jgi:hypothetical protein
MASQCIRQNRANALRWLIALRRVIDFGGEGESLEEWQPAGREYCTKPTEPLAAAAGHFRVAAAAPVLIPS